MLRSHPDLREEIENRVRVAVGLIDAPEEDSPEATSPEADSAE